MATKTDPGTFDCYHKALPDEPMFTLLARDEDAPFLVRKWAERRLIGIAHHRHPESDSQKVDEAYQCADAMEKWRKENNGAWRQSSHIEFSSVLVLSYDLLRFIGPDEQVTLSDFIIKPAEMERFNKIIFRSRTGDIVLKDRDGEVSKQSQKSAEANKVADPQNAVPTPNRDVENLAFAINRLSWSFIMAMPNMKQYPLDMIKESIQRVRPLLASNDQDFPKFT